MKLKLIFPLIIGLSLNSIALTSIAERTHHASLQPLNSIVAVVNKDVITESDLDTQMNLVRNQMRQINQKIPSDKVLRKGMLTQLIALKLQLQQAHRDGITVSDEQVDRAITNIAKQNHLSVASLKEQVLKQGLTFTQYRKQMKEQIAITTAQRRAITERITVSDQDIAAAMHKVDKKAETVTLYHLLAILVPVQSPDQIPAAELKAATILKNLKQGGKFEDVAIALSSDKFVLQGGDLGWKQLTEVPPDLTAKIAESTAGQILGPVQTSNGFVILKVAGIKSNSPNQKVTKEQVRNMLYQQKYQQLVQKWVKELSKTAFIKIVD